MLGRDDLEVCYILVGVFGCIVFIIISQGTIGSCKYKGRSECQLKHQAFGILW